MKRRGELSYYESKIKLLNMPNLDATLLRLGCWDAPIDSEGLSDQRRCRRFIKQCRKYYQKKIERILKEQGMPRQYCRYTRPG
jgi:hypothetical protein